MRIVGGSARGCAIVAPKGDQTRPTTDRVRETLFNILSHRFPETLRETRVLDLFSGSGALGLEALSRGAAFALFVETGAEARGVIRRNAETTGMIGSVRVWRRDALKLGPANLPPFDLVFADPPYGRGLGSAALEGAALHGWTTANCLAVLEEEAASVPGGIAGWVQEDVRQTGGTALSFWRRANADPLA